MNQNEIELAFIGSLINGREEMEIALEQGIESEYFSDNNARRIFEISKELYTAKKDIDISLIGSNVSEKEKDSIFRYLKESGGKIETPHTNEFAIEAYRSISEKKNKRTL